MTLKSDSRAEARISELEAALAHETRVSTALREVGLALGTTLDLDELLELILAKITDALEADRATLYLLDEAKDELVSRVVQGDELKSIRLKLGHGIAGHVARTGKSLNIKDAYKDPRFNPEWDVVTGYRTKSILVAPMKNHLGRTIGVVQVLNKKRAEFTDADSILLAALATQAAISIDNSRLFISVTQKNIQLLDTKEQLEHRVRDLKLLFELESAMGRSQSLEELFMGVLGAGMRTLGAGAAAVLFRDPEAPGCLLHFLDEKHMRLRRVYVKEEHGALGRAMRKGEPISNDGRSPETRNEPFIEDMFGFECATSIAVPLEGEGGDPLGAFALYNKQDGAPFSDEDRALVMLIAANASTAIRLQLAREHREREERLTTIGRLLSGVIHDLKTPLTVINGYAQLMQTSENKDERTQYAELINKQFELIHAMQRDVLEFARGEKSVLLRKVYISKFFEDVRKQLEQQLGGRNIELVVDIQDKNTARFDEGKIMRAVDNLARNAVEAMGEKGGRFVIRVQRDKDGAMVMTFSDTGPGIPKEIEPRLFESFVTSGKKGGTGLGLAIVKKIAEEHGGSVSVHSTTKGATFTLRLPQPTG